MTQPMPGRNRARSLVVASVFALGALAVLAPTATAVVPTPVVMGPIPSDAPGGADRNYTFFATDVRLAAYGYVEEEFFFDGKANVYNTSITPAAITSANHPYRSRLVVIRPSDPTRFKGVALVEWQNVTIGYDTDVHWQQQKDYIMRSGYAWVGVSAQNAGLSNSPNGIKLWSPLRYATLNVTDSGTVTGDALSYDIFGQGAQAVRNVPAVLGGLHAQIVLAIGASQSAGRLYTYFNAVHALDPSVYDGLVASQNNGNLRTDLTIPAIKVLSENEVTTNPGQADTPLIHTWVAAGSSHVDFYGIANRAAFLLRDLNLQAADAPCASGPTRSRIPHRHVLNAGTEALIRQIRTGVPPPTGPKMEYAGSPAVVARDAFGNALGGIRVANFEVPVALDRGAICGLSGLHVPFSKGTLDALYGNHGTYVSMIARAADASVAAGFVLPEDAQTTIDDAAASIYGFDLDCAELCANVGQFPVNPSSSLLREQTLYFDIVEGAPLVALMDEVTKWVARGYTYPPGPKAQQGFAKAIALLQEYIEQLMQAKSEGRVAPESASLLINQANKLIQSIAAL